MKKKVCKNCKFIFTEGDNCPACKSNQFATSFKGRLYVVDPSRSEIAKKLEITVKGEYAIKVG